MEPLPAPTPRPLSRAGSRETGGWCQRWERVGSRACVYVPGSSSRGNTRLRRASPVRDRSVYTAPEDAAQPGCGGVHTEPATAASLCGGAEGGAAGRRCVYGVPARGAALSRSQTCHEGERTGLCAFLGHQQPRGQRSPETPGRGRARGRRARRQRAQSAGGTHAPRCLAPPTLAKGRSGEGTTSLSGGGLFLPKPPLAGCWRGAVPLRPWGRPAVPAASLQAASLSPVLLPGVSEN